MTIGLVSSDWFTSFPTPDVHWTGPDFDSILQRFKNLDAASIAQALQLIVNFVKELAHPTTPNAISDVLNTNLPLINKSLSQLLDIASDVAAKIQAAITSPSDAIQELNNILANAFGMPTPSVAISENQHGTLGTPEKILVVVDALAGSFRLTFPPNRGPPVTTESISFDPATTAANATAIQNALNKLDGVDVTVTVFGGGYLVTFNVNGAQPLFFADATKLVKTNLLTYVNGEIDFEFDLGSSIQIARPFNLDLSLDHRLAAGPARRNRQHPHRRRRQRQPHGQRRRESPHRARPRPERARLALCRRPEHQRDGRHVQGHVQRPHDHAARLEHLARRPRRSRCRLLPGLGSATVGGTAGSYTITGGTQSLYSVDGTALTGSERSFFLKTGSGDHDTHLDLTASAAGTNLNFDARLGPFGLFIKDGSASLGGTIRLNFLTGPHSGRFNLVSFGDGTITSDLGSIGDFIGAGSVCVNPRGGLCDNTLHGRDADLPLSSGRRASRSRSTTRSSRARPRLNRLIVPSA